jgi:hypothetical protein
MAIKPNDSAIDGKEVQAVLVGRLDTVCSDIAQKGFGNGRLTNIHRVASGAKNWFACYAN